MVERRWLLRLVPPGVGVSAAGLALAATIGAAEGSWEPPACPGRSDALSARRAEPTADDDRPRGWFTLDPDLDESGALAGQRLRLGVGPARGRYVELPPETAASGPFGHLVVVAADDGRRSTITAYDVGAGCNWSIGTSSHVIRRATLDPAGSGIYEYRVDRRTRADLGVWRRPLDGSPPRRVVAPLPADERVGRIFVTTLGWSADGSDLVVQSCGAARCRTRLLDVDEEHISSVSVLHGELVGVADGRLIAYDTCVALPCPLLAFDIADGRGVEIASSARLAALARTPDGHRVVVETPSGLELRRLDGRLEAVLALGDGRHLVPPAHRARAGVAVPPGWLVLSPDGRSPEGAVLTRLSDGTTVPVAEVTR